jgi:hypothetical protein
VQQAPVIHPVIKKPQPPILIDPEDKLCLDLATNESAIMYAAKKPGCHKNILKAAEMLQKLAKVNEHNIDPLPVTGISLFSKQPPSYGRIFSGLGKRWLSAKDESIYREMTRHTLEELKEKNIFEEERLYPRVSLTG